MRNIGCYGIGLAIVAVVALGCGVEDPEEPLTSETDEGRIGMSGQTVIEATSPADWVYWDFSAGSVVTIADPDHSTDWDVRIRRTQLGTNSDTSGSGMAGVVNTDSTAWAAVTEAPADGYEVDAMLPIPGPPGSGEYSGNPALADWFNYDEVTHAVSSKGLVCAVRTADGQYAKLSILSYAGGQMTIRWQYQPDGSRSLP